MNNVKIKLKIDFNPSKSFHEEGEEGNKKIDY